MVFILIVLSNLNGMKSYYKPIAPTPVDLFNKFRLVRILFTLKKWDLDIERGGELGQALLLLMWKYFNHFCSEKPR